MPEGRDEWPDWEEHPPGPRKVVRWAIIGAVLLFIVLPGAVWGLNLLTRPARVAGQVGERITDPDRLIATYEGYYDKCTAVVALDGNAKTAEATYQEWRKSYDPKNDPLGLQAQEGQRLRTDRDGIRQRRREVAAAYNSQSLQITRLNGLTKGSDLPTRIEEGVTPRCGNFDTVEVQ